MNEDVKRVVAKGSLIDEILAAGTDIKALTGEVLQAIMSFKAINLHFQTPK